jgi:hypothetical protein
MSNLTRLALVVPFVTASAALATVATAQDVAPDPTTLAPAQSDTVTNPPPPATGSPVVASPAVTPPAPATQPPYPSMAYPSAAYPGLPYPQGNYVRPYYPPVGYGGYGYSYGPVPAYGYGNGYGYSYGSGPGYSWPNGNGWVVGPAPPPPQIARMYCDYPAGYYPYVHTCYGRWIHYH